MSAFGIREVCHCVFTPKDPTKHPSFVIDTAKMSSLESASTTVYAQGGSGNSRLMAWEGEKTLTFTIEDALLTRESFRALTGASVSNNNNTFTIYPTSFAGYYSITAYTLLREQDTGIDKVTTITIPKAKLQTQLNLSMSPTGDPSTFTFTFDALPDNENNNQMFTLAIGDDIGTDSLSDKTAAAAAEGATRVFVDGREYIIPSTVIDPTLTYNANAIALPAGTTPSASITISEGNSLTNGAVELNKAEEKVALKKGSVSWWQII